MNTFVYFAYSIDTVELVLLKINRVLKLNLTLSNINKINN